MQKICAIALVLVVFLIGSAASADVVLFKGDPIRVAGINVGGWGSGTAVEASDRVYTGSRCIKITSQGFHEGGRIDFSNPVDLMSDPVDYNTDYLEFTLGFTTIIRTDANAASSRFNNPMVPGPSGLTPGGSYYSGGQEIEAPSRPKVNKIRVVMESTEGKSIEATADVPTQQEDGWYRVSIPYKIFGLKQGEPFHVSRIILFTDLPDTVFLGQVSTVKDDTPISVNIGDDQVVAVYDTVTLRAEAEAGASMLKYSWNFGDRDPEGEDATGEFVSHKYIKGGDFTVKLTVSDVWGIKKPAVQTLKITVND